MCHQPIHKKPYKDTSVNSSSGITVTVPVSNMKLITNSSVIKEA